MTSDAFHYSSSNIFDNLNKYEHMLKISSIFLPLISTGLILKTFQICLLGINLRTSTCDTLLQNAPFYLKIISIIISILGDNLHFVFIYYKYVYLLKVNYCWYLINLKKKYNPDIDENHLFNKD